MTSKVNNVKFCCESITSSESVGIPVRAVVHTYVRIHYVRSRANITRVSTRNGFCISYIMTAIFY